MPKVATLWVVKNPMPRDALFGIKAYKAGAAAPVDDMKLASNENPFGPLPSVVEAITKEAQRINRYPDPAVRELYSLLANRFGLPESNFAIGAGSSTVLMNLIRIMCEPEDEVIYAWRSFEGYPLAVSLADARGVQVPLTDDGQHDLGAMLKEITSATKVIILCSPNNPNGTIISAGEIYDFLEKVPSDVLVIFDEAYAEFVRAADAARGLSLFTSFNNVAVLRSFSKAHGLAGLRIGYTLAPEAIAEAVRKVTAPFAVTNLAAHAAVASLNAQDEFVDRVDQIVAERDRMVLALRTAGWEIPEPQGNFVWLDLGGRSADFAQACVDAGLTVRLFSDEGVRVSIGLPEANDAFLKIAQTGWV